MKTIVGVTVAIALAGVAACGSSTSVSAVKAPTDLIAAPLLGGAHLTWKDNSDNEGGFMIERMAGGGAWTPLTMVEFNITEYHDPNLTAGAVYMYRVMAMPKSGGKETASAYSNEVTFTAPSDSTGAGGAGGGGTSGAAGSHAGTAGSAHQ